MFLERPLPALPKDAGYKTENTFERFLFENSRRHALLKVAAGGSVFLSSTTKAFKGHFERLVLLVAAELCIFHVVLILQRYRTQSCRIVEVSMKIFKKVLEAKNYSRLGFLEVKPYVGHV